jgi:hypothetical protein
MKVLNIIPEKLHITFSIDSDELNLLDRALSMCKIEFNGDNPEDVKSKDFFVNDFSKGITELTKELLEQRD